MEKAHYDSAQLIMIVLTKKEDKSINNKILLYGAFFGIIYEWYI